VLQGDSEIEDYQIIHTPGHTPGSICLSMPEKIIFTGDILVSDSKGNPRPPTMRLLLNRIQAWDSLVKIAALDYDILLPGHGAPVVGHTSQKVKEMVELLDF
jgi:hydroxyacylglutathione hydrolase